MADDNETTADLAALAAAAQGEVAHWRMRGAPRDEARERKIAELKAKYLAGDLSIDDKALAAKLIDSLFDPPPDVTP
jgi:anti-sigma28 factor (negative regulator of flagellin synthesis)